MRSVEVEDLSQSYCPETPVFTGSTDFWYQLGVCRNFEKRDPLDEAALASAADGTGSGTAVQTDFFYPESAKLSPEPVEVPSTDFYIEFVVAYRNLDSVLA